MRRRRLSCGSSRMAILASMRDGAQLYVMLRVCMLPRCTSHRRPLCAAERTQRVVRRGCVRLRYSAVGDCAGELGQGMPYVRVTCARPAEPRRVRRVGWEKKRGRKIPGRGIEVCRGAAASAAIGFAPSTRVFVCALCLRTYRQTVILSLRVRCLSVRGRVYIYLSIYL